MSTSNWTEAAEQLKKTEEARQTFKSEHWEFFCDHANENPVVCPCPPSCGCRATMCQGKDSPTAEASMPPIAKDFKRLIDTPLFTVKDSGQRQEFASGMVRDTTTGKTDYSLCFDGPMFERLAEHLTKGAAKYEARNWMKASGEEELTRFKTSAIRHFMQWMRGECDEDHAAAVFFNINGYEYVKEQL